MVRTQVLTIYEVVWLGIPLYKRYSCMAVYTFVQNGQLYGCVYLRTRGTVIWLCIPLNKRYSCMAVFIFEQEVQLHGCVYL